MKKFVDQLLKNSPLFRETNLPISNSLNRRRLIDFANALEKARSELQIHDCSIDRRRKHG